MADVRERGQLFLIGGLSLAVVFVVLAVTLNSAIYTENLATRGSGTADADAVEQARADAVRGVGGLMEHSIESHIAYTDQEDAVESGVLDVHSLSRRYASQNGRLIELKYQSSAQGVRIVHEDDGDFQEGEDDVDPNDWIVATDVPAVRQFRMDVDRTSLNDASLLESFHITFIPTDASDDTFTVYVHRMDASDTTTVTVHRNGVFEGSCTDDDGSRTIVDVTDATVGGSYCPPLTFLNEFESVYQITYINGDDAVGTYELTVEKSSIVDAPYDGDDAPTKQPAIYSSTVQFYFESNRFVYQTDLRVAPGEPDE